MLDWKLVEDDRPKEMYWAVKDNESKVHIWLKKNALKRTNQFTKYIELGEYRGRTYAKAKWESIKKELKDD